MRSPVEYKMQLSELLHGVDVINAFVDIEVNGLTMDSRAITAGDVFVAVKGLTTDGHKYIDDALSAGAVVVLADHMEPQWQDKPVIAIELLRNKLGLIADRFYGSPSKAMSVIGVTGTNGKTTCTYLTAQALNAGGERCGLIGTLGVGYPDKLNDSGHTTPDVISVHRQLARFRDELCTHVCMEVSSHALDQGRVDHVDFDIAVFTNLSRDHLDYHGTMENYGNAKQNLFRSPGLRCAVVNREDDYSEQIAESFLARDHDHGERLITYGFKDANINATSFEATDDGIRLSLAYQSLTIDVSCQLLGRFNAANLLAVAAVLICLGKSFDNLPAILSGMKSAAGRMEIFHRGQSPVVVVDYAHTPDALEKALQALREHVNGKLWCVFGCGGDRDSGKRAIMGQIAESLADYVVLTDDNPRTESADNIITDITSGMNRQPLVVQPREKAIRHAITKAGRHDIVLVAGKGHEDYQEIAGKRIHYSDRETVAALLEDAA
jgi:UDP-N-acetylmuramoyl-L-alanyl-D-glutamate--2,6-diaminopimelate ligase